MEKSREIIMAKLYQKNKDFNEKKNYLYSAPEFVSVEQDPLKKILSKLLSLEDKLLSLENKIEQRLSGLEDKIEQRLLGLEDKIEQKPSGLEDKIEQKPSGIEGKLNFFASNDKPQSTVQFKTPVFADKEPAPFSLFSNPISGNPFAESLKKYNLPTVGDWTKKEEPKPTEAANEDDGPAPAEELPIENTCDLKPIEIKSGEEDEAVLFEQRCKLFRFRDKEYKERGVGNLRVLRHRETQNGRLIMRRDQIGLVCLNCWDCKKIERIRETQVRWVAIDASDSDPQSTIFIVKFKNPASTDEFFSHLQDLFPDGQCPTSPRPSQSPQVSQSSGTTTNNSISTKPDDNKPNDKPQSTVQFKTPVFADKEPAPFSLFSNPISGNPFAESLKKYNLPTVGDWTKKEEPKPTEAANEDDGPAPAEELPIENTCDLKPIEIKSGEEDEAVLFEQRCKLFRFRDKEYKERGVGNLRVLRHRETQNGRLIMRRDQIGLVCLNCWDCKKIERIRETQVRWVAIDASDSDPQSTIFIVKFKNPASTDEFFSHLQDLFPDGQCPTSPRPSQSPQVSQSSGTTTNNSISTKPDIELVSPQLDPDLVDRARRLQLPDLFYHILPNQEPCVGCDGCGDD